MKEKLEQLLTEGKAKIEAVRSETELQEIKALLLGKQGSLTELLKELPKLDVSLRPEMGKAVNQAKAQLTELLDARRNELKMKASEVDPDFDISVPGILPPSGGLHPITQMCYDLNDAFRSMGFEIYEEDDITSELFGFDNLNFPPNHPARSMQDTFYVDRCDEKGMQLPLRPHTSPMQVRYARTHTPPIKVIAPGRTYRVDSDATHSPMFHQVEGLWVAENISFADLKGVYTDFLRRFFETEDLKVRFRPSYFPFTEPSVEVDMAFTSGPRKGKWLEISGAGEVHPNVIRNYGLDPEKYIGFAFGSGLERLTMLRYGIDDLRLFFEGDLRFLRQFK